MYIARILYPVKVLGPGDRVGLWFAGCVHSCKGCSNPELWEQKDKYKTDFPFIKNIIDTVCRDKEIDGFTLTGGDPFYQPDVLCKLLPYLKNISKDILVYTGYSYKEIEKKYPDCLKYISVLIDGKYKEKQNKGLPLRGSANQNIIFIDKSVKEDYENYMLAERSPIQNFATSDGVISVGIHLPGFMEELNKRLLKKGLKEADNNG